MSDAHVGIVACSAEGAALCYRTFCVEGGDDHPEVSVHTTSLATYMRLVERDDWRSVGELLLSSASKLKSIGATFAICPDNTVHQGLDLVRHQSALPWLHIAEVVAVEARRRGFQKLALLGTRYLMTGPVYPTKLANVGVDVAIPNANERDAINDAIFEELVRGRFDGEARSTFQRVIERMKRDEGCDAAALCCTEIPLVIDDDNSALPTLDSTRLLARAALERARA